MATFWNFGAAARVGSGASDEIAASESGALPPEGALPGRASPEKENLPMAHERFESVRTDPPAPPFPPHFYDEPIPTPIAILGPPPSAEATYVMLQTTGPVDPSDCEELGSEAIEVTVLWGTNVLEVFHLSPPRPFVVGSERGEGVDFLLPPELAGFGRTAIVEVSGGSHRVVAPHGASLRARGEKAGLAPDGALSPGKVLDLELGTLTFRVAAVTAGKRVPRAIGVDARGIGTSLLCSFGAAAAFLGVVAYYTPALGASLDGDLDRDQAARMLPYLTALAEREEKRQEADGDKPHTDSPTPGTAAQGPSGAMGRPNQPVVARRTAIAGNGEVVLSKHEALREASTFGLVGMLATMNGRALPTALWGADVPNGPDASDAWGQLYAEDIGESGGQNGLGLTGPGNGGGGYGQQIGIGSIGTCGTNCGFGTGRSAGRTGGTHVSKGPSLRPLGDVTVGGHLAPELIQRVVRQNFGRFRACYEVGLRGNPNLTGRVTARFVIDREGTVSTASNGGSDLPDSKVVSCVVSAFYGVSFPAPKDGVVRVSYPIMFSPG
jgi:hypothetical protein